MYKEAAPKTEQFLRRFLEGNSQTYRRSDGGVDQGRYSEAVLKESSKFPESLTCSLTACWAGLGLDSSCIHKVRIGMSVKDDLVTFQGM